MLINAESIVCDLKLIREKKPLIHNVTNYVSMNWVANGLLSIGASPVMAHAQEEITDIVRISGALVLNIGTLSAPWIQSMHQALKVACDVGIPVVLDPVGAGATPYRTQTARALLEQGGITVVRGNASEICALAGDLCTTKGVDSSLLPSEACAAAQNLSREFGCVVVASGPEDLIIGEAGQVRVYNGTAMMARVTGIGCLVSAAIGAFCAVQPDWTKATAHAMAYCAIVGERAAVNTMGLGSYAVAYIDLLGELKEEWIAKLLTVECYARSN